MTKKERAEINRLRRLKSKEPEQRAKALAYRSSDRWKFKSYRGDAKRRGHEFILEFEEFQSFINKPCEYCGESPSRGVDRINNDLGYSLLNCASCCRMCNHMKSNHSESTFLNHVKKIFRNIFSEVDVQPTNEREKHEVSQNQSETLSR